MLLEKNQLNNLKLNGFIKQIQMIDSAVKAAYYEIIWIYEKIEKFKDFSMEGLA